MKAPAELGAFVAPLLECLSNVGIGVVVIADRDGAIQRWYTNEPAAALVGYTVDEIAAIPPLDIIVPEQRKLALKLSASFRDGQPVPPVLEFSMLHKDGSSVSVELALGFHQLSDGVAYVLVLRDVNANQPSHLSLLEADRIGLVGALAAGFAHEINNPLTSVLLNLRSLRKHLGGAGQPPAQVTRCLDDITTGSERIASNVRALQTLATRSGLTHIDLAAVVSSALRLATPTLEPRAHVIRQIFPVPPVSGEESRLGQAVLAMMLFSSSGFETDSTTANNRIVVVVEERQGDVVVEVSDNGRDLTPEEARRAFDPFFRSPARGAGVGVGLGVARSVATNMGGDVALAPRPGGGAVITMRLPAAPADPA
jgi:two-component system, NtrC family, sensor kinase